MVDRDDWMNATPAHMFGHVLCPDELVARTVYRYADPGLAVSRWVERYWSVEWEFDDAQVFHIATLDDPSTNLTWERGGISRARSSGEGVWVTGPATSGRFDVSLNGRGSVIGVKFHLGGTRAFVEADLVSLRD